MDLIPFHLKKAGLSLFYEVVAWQWVADHLSTHLLACGNFKAELLFPFFCVQGQKTIFYTEDTPLRFYFCCRIHSYYLDWDGAQTNRWSHFFFPEAKGLKLGRYFSRLYCLSTLCNQPRGCHWDHCCYDNIDKWVGFQRRWVEQHILQLFWQTIDSKGSSKRKRNDWGLRVWSESCPGCLQNSLTCSNMNRENHLVHCKWPDVQTVHRHHTINCEDELFHAVVTQALWNTCQRKSMTLLLLIWMRLLVKAKSAAQFSRTPTCIESLLWFFFSSNV